jgi:mannose-6-phosphate isomerase-like protein (cupin superfamily)
MRVGETICNRRTGESLTLLADGKGAGQPAQRYRVVLPPGRAGPPPHYHVAFAETFAVVDGALDMFVGRRMAASRLLPGESLTVEPGTAHTFENSAGNACTLLVTARPAGGVVDAFKLAYGIANEGGAGRDGLPKNPIIRLRFIEISGGFLPRIPRRLQSAVLLAARWIAQATGLEHGVRRHLDA